jgi:hypothetical protein
VATAVSLEVTVPVAAVVPVATAVLPATVPVATAVVAAVTLAAGTVALTWATPVWLGRGSTGGDGSPAVGWATGAFAGAYCAAELDVAANTKAATNMASAAVNNSPLMVVITRELFEVISSLLS